MNEEMQTVIQNNRPDFQQLQSLEHKSNIFSNGFGNTNSLIAAASPVLLLFIQLRDTQANIDANQLRKKIVAEMNIFTNQAKASQCPSHIILAARYCLCTALDEAILLTPWGSQSDWAQQSLLSRIHRETWGGERFFIILEKMSAEPKKNLSLLELLYFLLALGFEGKYYNENRILREGLQHRLCQLIAHYHPEANKKLSPSLEILNSRQLQKVKQLNHLKFWGCVLGIFLSIGIVFNIMLYWKAKPFLQNLKDINMAQSAFVYAKLPVKNTIILEKLPQTYLRAKHTRHHHYRVHGRKNNNIELPPPVWGNE